MASQNIEYKCSYCGKISRTLAGFGRPEPGECPRKPKDKNGRYKPHTWVKNRSW